MSETKLELAGLSSRPSQVWGSVRLVPLLRDEPIEDLRLDRRCWDATAVVSLADDSRYVAFVPHAFVATWSPDGTPLATLGTQVARSGERPKRLFPVVQAKRMVRRERQHGRALPRLRFLPLHTAFEAYLALHFAGPDVLRREYTDHVLSQGLSPRVESVTPGEWVPGLEEALRVFEIVEGQVGVLLFVGDVFTAAFVVPHPDDYRRLHRSLLADFYGQTILHHAWLAGRAAPLLRRFRDEHIGTLAELRLELVRARADWSAQLHDMSRGLLEQPVHLQHVYRLGRHHMFRCLPTFRLKHENHIGELIRAPGGEVAYLKTFRLTEAQIRRGYMLDSLARHDWDLYRTAEAQGTTRDNLVRGIERAGFGELLRAHVRAGARG